jgi:hypothetical protein
VAKCRIKDDLDADTAVEIARALGEAYIQFKLANLVGPQDQVEEMKDSYNTVLGFLDTMKPTLLKSGIEPPPPPVLVKHPTSTPIKYGKRDPSPVVGQPSPNYQQPQPTIGQHMQHPPQYQFSPHMMPPNQAVAQQPATPAGYQMPPGNMYMPSPGQAPPHMQYPPVGQNPAGPPPFFGAPPSGYPMQQTHPQLNFAHSSMYSR